jgi:hypothetical protein
MEMGPSCIGYFAAGPDFRLGSQAAVWTRVGRVRFALIHDQAGARNESRFGPTADIAAPIRDTARALLARQLLNHS